MYRCSTRSVASVRSLLQKLKCRRDGQATCSLHVQAQRCARHGTCSVQPVQQDVTLLEEKEPGSTPVRITLADNPSVIICHHPPNKVRNSGVPFLVYYFLLAILRFLTGISQNAFLGFRNIALIFLCQDYKITSLPLLQLRNVQI